MLRKVILATATASLLSLSAFAACDMRDGGGMGCEKQEKGKHQKGGKGCGDAMKGGGCCGGAMMSLSTVKLTPEQKSKIDAINEEFRAEMAKLHIKEKGMKDPFVVAGGFNKEAFKKERAEKMQKHLDMKAEHLAKIWAVLTPEQQKSIAALAK